MRILITGSSGFVGKHLVKKLLPKYQIVRYDLKNGQDVLNEELLLEKLKGVDVVVHLAAFISAEESWSKPKEYFVNNALGTLSVVKCSIKSSVKKIIYFSSAAVKARPLTPYALSKIAGENFVKLYSKDINTVIVRPENIYGPGQKEAYGYVIHNFIKAVKSGKDINIYGTGLYSRDFIYIDDVILVVSQIIEKNISGKTYSLGTGKDIKIKALAKLVSRLLGKEPFINFLPARKEPRLSMADLNTFKKSGIECNFLKLEEGIKKLIKLEYSK